MASNEHAPRKFTAQDWEVQRKEIARLYEDDTLESVMKYMLEKHGLEASPKQYKDRIKKWGLNKHIQKEEMEAMIRIRKERRVVDNKTTAFILRGRPVNEEKIDRYEREHSVPTTAEGGGGMDLDTPPDLSYHTPGRVQSPITEDGFSSQAGSNAESGPFSQVSSTSSPHSSGYPSYPSYPSSGYTYGQVPPPPPRPQFSGKPPPPPFQSLPQLPPTNPQSFGGPATGAPAGYSYQYSSCTGRRKGLLIGINYFGQRGQLRGCVNDVKNMASFLNECYGFRRDDVVILTDDQQNPMSQPTKQNILRAMHWLVKDARPNDSLFFHYSGHGGQTKDLDGDEDEGYDEVIYPVDFRDVGHIVDDEMHRIMVMPLAAGVRLTAIFDSCHSGTALDLPYIYSTQGVLKEPNLAKEAGQGLLGILSSYSQRDVGSVASSVLGMFKKQSKADEKTSEGVPKRHTRTAPADVIMLSNSRDDQLSSLEAAEAATKVTGAMSWAFINALKKNPQQSYVQLLNSVRDEIAMKFTGKPQLSCSHPLNTNLLFIL